MDIFNEVKGYLHTRFSIPYDKIKYEATFMQDLGLTSLSLVEMCAELEQKFNVNIDEDVMVDFTCIGDIIEYFKENTTILECE